MLKSAGDTIHINLPEGKHLYFASDFHLGAPTHESSRTREKVIINWLDYIKPKAGAIFLLGDIFDFWFEYHHVIPKGYIRLQGKLAELADAGIPLVLFTGNHDMWMFDYFPQEINLKIFRHPKTLYINNKKIMAGHGDGLGTSDKGYKILKKIFHSSWSQKAFRLIHPDLGIAIANAWSSKSRNGKEDEKFINKENEWIFNYCQALEQKDHHDYYIFGHRHLPLDLDINVNSKYINLGEWMSNYSYALFDGEQVRLQKFKEA